MLGFAMSLTGHGSQRVMGVRADNRRAAKDRFLETTTATTARKTFVDFLIAMTKQSGTFCSAFPKARQKRANDRTALTRDTWESESTGTGCNIERD